MEENKVVHFEELWEEAEKISEGNNSSKLEIYAGLDRLLSDYQNLDKLESLEIRKTLKTKKLGEILFKITELSRIDDVNSYESLKLEIDRRGSSQ